MNSRKNKARLSIAVCMLSMSLLCHAQSDEALLASTTQVLTASVINALDETLLNYWLQLDDTTVAALLDDEMPLLQPNSPTLPSPESSDLN